MTPTDGKMMCQKKNTSQMRRKSKYMQERENNQKNSKTMLEREESTQQSDMNGIKARNKLL